MTKRQTKQLPLRLNTWGGKRAGAGRPKDPDSGESHLMRPPFAARYPVLVTTRLLDIRTLRNNRCYAVVRRALELGGHRPNFRLVHYSVQSNHLHLICEASSPIALSKGMQGLLIRIARGLNRVLERNGKVFEDRYNSRALRTPTEVRNALEYVLHNARKHAKRAGKPKPFGWIDSKSSARGFFGLEDLPDPLLPEPRTWLLREGWRKAGQIPIDG